MSDIFSKFDPLEALHDQIVDLAGIDPLGMEMGEMYSATEADVAGKRCILLGSNNYLGLTFDEDAVKASCEAVKAFGTGTTGSRVANGSYAGHEALEKQLAVFYGKDHAMLFTTGYQANVGFLSAIAGKDDFLLIDSESHASIYDGCNLGKATVLLFRHNDPKDLEKRLARLPKDANKLVVTEGIFSMRGDKAPLKKIVTVAKKYDAYVMVDEAHSLGILGEGGRGLCEEAGVMGDVDFIIGTFSKSIGTIGGFCVSNHAGLETMRFSSRAYVFTASLPPSVVASASKTLARLDEDRGLRETLWRNTDILYDGLQALGYKVGPDKNPIIGVMMPELAKGLKAWRALYDAGVYVNLALPPATPAGTCLLRCSVNAAHSEAQLQSVLNVFAEIRPLVEAHIGAAAE